MSYFSTLHKQPVEHRKRFALFVSGTITVFIFGIWSLVRFGGGEEVLAEQDKRVKELGPFESLSSSIAGSFQAIKESFGQLKSSTADIYGQ